jgi:hypothetical protein
LLTSRSVETSLRAPNKGKNGKKGEKCKRTEQVNRVNKTISDYYFVSLVIDMTRIFTPNRDEMIVCWRKLHNEVPFIV